MTIALLSDLHANLQAVHACLRDARARGAVRFAFLGDLVGYGADPGPVLDIVMTMSAAGAPVLLGNHDEAAITPERNSTRPDHVGGAWTHAQLSPAHLAFLRELPLTAKIGGSLLAHASAHEPQRWHYVTTPQTAAQSLAKARDAGATHVFVGHVHEQRLFYEGAAGRAMAFEPTPGVPIPVRPHRTWLASIGSVGQPRDGRPEAMYALFDPDGHELTFLRVPYDHSAAADAIRRAGLPESNAARLSRGL